VAVTGPQWRQLVLFVDAFVLCDERRKSLFCEKGKGKQLEYLPGTHTTFIICNNVNLKRYVESL
jgi:hypothetical protein